MHKGVTVAEQVEACRRAHEAGIAPVDHDHPGSGRRRRPRAEALAASERHARATGAAFSRIEPEFIGVLSLMVIPGTPTRRRVAAGTFIVPRPLAMLRELREMIAAIDVTECAVPVEPRLELPARSAGGCRRTRRRMLAALDAVLTVPTRCAAAAGGVEGAVSLYERVAGLPLTIEGLRLEAAAGRGVERLPAGDHAW